MGSLFNTILESVINEVKTDFAYEKFYNSIPREDFDRIVGGAPDIDKFIQFLINSVRDNNSSVDEAAEAAEEYRTSDPLIRQAVKNSFEKGEYENAKEVLTDIKYLKSGGVINKNKFAKQGYIKVAENDDWIITCTTNYLANNHYFGDSRWCTASDRMGRYDGYEMFCNYAKESGALLFQATNKKDRDKMYQIQVRVNSDYDDEDVINPTVDCICNKADVRESYLDVKSEVGDILPETIENKEIIKKLFDIQVSQYEPEEKYQRKQDEVIYERRRRREQALEAKRTAVEQEVDRLNNEKMAETMPIFKQFIDQELYKNSDILSKIYENYYTGETDEESLRKTYYAHLYDVFNLNPYVKVGQLGLNYGHYWYYDEVYDENDDVCDYEVRESEDGETYPVMFIVFTIKDDDRCSCLKTFGKRETPSRNGARFTIVDGLDAELKERFFSLNYYGEDEICFIDTLKGREIPIEYDHNDEWYSDVAPSRAVTFSDGKIVVYSTSPLDRRVIEIDDRTGEYDVRKNDDRYVFGGIGGRFVASKKTGEMLKYDSHGKHSYKLPTDVLEYASEIEPTEVENFIEINGNIFDMDKNDMVFGVRTYDTRVRVTEDETYRQIPVVIGTYQKNGNVYVIRYMDGKYETSLRTWQTHYEPCDKWGRTEKEQQAQKNLKYWQNKGGHSKLTQGQMDKMWADREREHNDDQMFDRSDALQSWRDEDTPKSLERQDAEDLDRRRYDYEGDQPWLSDDEIPANLSDRVVRESRKRQSINKVIDLMNRLIKD